jgi:hypothetical protein
MKQIHIAAITESGVCDIFTASTERKLIDKLENYLSNEVKFNTLQDFKDHLYDNEVYENCEVFFEVQDVEFE